MGMKDLVDQLAAKRARIRRMGGDEAIAKQHGAGKLTVRERIDLLFDAGSFSEIGIQATHAGIAPDMAGKETPADGVVTGFGRIDGRLASLIAYDFTVMAGSMGRTAEVKCSRAREIAYTKRFPMVWLIDSAGARIQEAIGSKSFAGSALLFREESVMSGVVPRSPSTNFLRRVESSTSRTLWKPGACWRRPAIRMDSKHPLNPRPAGAPTSWMESRSCSRTGKLPALRPT